MLTRRAIFTTATGFAAAMVGAAPVLAAGQVVKVGINFSFTGADAADAQRSGNGALLAFEEANAAKLVPGITFQPEKYDDGTATAGQYDPAQAATNARKMVADKAILAAVGPQMSGAGKAMSPILSAGNLATITPTSTNPDITDPKFAAQYRPKGRAIYFRTVATDAFQGPNMANFMAQSLHVRSLFVLDDSGAYGVGLADAFQRQATKIGLTVLGRDRVDPKAADYAAVLTRIRSLEPQALYYGGVSQAGVKLAKQGYEIIPGVIKAGGDGMWSNDLLAGAGFPAVEGWYATQASPHVVGDPKVATFTQRFNARFNMQPDDYAITAYVAAGVVVAAVKGLAAAGRPVTRDAVRDAIQNIHLEDTLLGPVAFDENGDIRNKIISVYQIRKNPTAPLDDTGAQYAYVGIAPMA